MGWNVVGWILVMRGSSYDCCHSILLISQGKQSNRTVSEKCIQDFNGKFLSQHFLFVLVDSNEGKEENSLRRTISTATKCDFISKFELELAASNAKATKFSDTQ